MYQAIFYTHVTVSFVALLLGLISLSIAIRGLIKRQDYLKWYRSLGKIYVISLYIQLAMGLLMFYYPGSDKAALESSAIDPGNSPNIRFWEIEHVAIMVFALFIVQIGCIFIGKTRNPGRKFRLVLVYFGIPLIMMIFSMVMSMR